MTAGCESAVASRTYVPFLLRCSVRGRLDRGWALCRALLAITVHRTLLGMVIVAGIIMRVELRLVEVGRGGIGARHI